MDDPVIGTRVDGKRHIRERWYSCDICGRHVPMSDTTVPDAPHPHAGRRLCLTSGSIVGCFDDNDYQMNVALGPPRPSSTELLP
jgi:hypothetical protein